MSVLSFGVTINGFVDSKALALNENGDTPPPVYTNGDTLGLKSRISDAAIPFTKGRSLAYRSIGYELTVKKSPLLPL